MKTQFMERTIGSEHKLLSEFTLDILEKLISSFPKAKCQGFNSQTPTQLKLKGYDLRRCDVNHLLIEEV